MSIKQVPVITYVVSSYKPLFPPPGLLYSSIEVEFKTCDSNNNNKKKTFLYWKI